MALSSPGIGSGLDVAGLVNQLMALERRPLAQFESQEAVHQAKISAYGSLKGAIASFQSAVKALSSPAKFSVMAASIADTEVASVTASPTAVPGNYSLEVTALAQAEKLRSESFASRTATVGSGTITVEFGAYGGGVFTPNEDKAAKTITIDSSNNTLSGIRDAINSAGAGISANIVNDGSGYRLVISSTDSGAENSLKITTNDDDAVNMDTAGLSQLAYDPEAVAGGGKNLTQSVAAQDAAFLLDGVSISSATNVVADAIEGVTLKLLAESDAAATTITVSRDISGVKSSIESFVKAYNELAKTIKDLSAYNTETKQASILTGDAALRGVDAQLRETLNTALRYAGGGLTMLSQVGISFQKDGTLAFDSSKLQTVFDDTTKDVSTLFASVGKSTDSLIEFTNASSTAEAGAYSIDISQLATQGTAEGAVTLGGTTTITGGVNDSLTVLIDGVTATVTLTAGDYTAAEMAAHLQSKINGAEAVSSAGLGVTVTQSAGMLTITSNTYGATSTATVSGGTAQAALFGTTNDTAGLDVAGSIGGVVGTGTGQSLSAAGITLKVTGIATGSRGTLNFAQGFAVQLDRLADKLLASDGSIAGRTDGLKSSIDMIGARREELQRRLEIIETRYRAQFSALDTMIASMSRTSSFLQQQLSSLPSPRS
jgi:flagellar hook-associated protein 2